MSVILGGEELPNVQEITTRENRSLVEHWVPGRDGPVLQDLGEGLTLIQVSGIVHGDAARDALQSLRDRYHETEPVAFSADITTGIDVLDVIVRRFTIHQVAGSVNRYRYSVELARMVEPSEAGGAETVDQEVSTAANTWMQEASGREAALQDPSVLPEVLQENPGALEGLGINELGGAITEDLDNLSGEDFGNIIGSVSELSPDSAMGLLDAVGDAGGIAGLIDKYVEEGKSLLEDLTGMSLDELTTLAKGFIGGTDFLKRAKAVGQSAKGILASLKDADPFAVLSSSGEPHE